MKAALSWTVLGLLVVAAWLFIGTQVWMAHR